MKKETKLSCCGYNAVIRKDKKNKNLWNIYIKYNEKYVQYGYSEKNKELAKMEFYSNVASGNVDIWIDGYSF